MPVRPRIPVRIVMGIHYRATLSNAAEQLSGLFDADSHAAKGHKGRNQPTQIIKNEKWQDIQVLFAECAAEKA